MVSHRGDEGLARADWRPRPTFERVEEKYSAFDGRRDSAWGANADGSGAQRVVALAFGGKLPPDGRWLSYSSRQVGSATSLATAPRIAPKPRIVLKQIPFGPKRRAETAAYSQRHYGLRTWRLANPRVIVQHMTGSNSFGSVFATFAANAPDPEFGERPGVCAHFVIDRDGTIHQLVRLDTLCRHTVGLNWTAFGIEHVGTSGRQILANRAQLSASLALTVWLMSRNRIELRNVIGHNESLTSPYHRERYRAWRCQTHGDWPRAEMGVYRRRLARLARRYRVPLGPPARPVTSRCR